MRKAIDYGLLPLLGWIAVYFLWSFVEPHTQANSENWRALWWFMTGVLGTLSLAAASLIRAINALP